MTPMTLKRVGTPCVGICSTTYGDTVCRGCKRFLHEVVDWNRYSDPEKRLVWRRLDELLCLVVDNYIEVTDPSRLREQMVHQNLRLQANSRLRPGCRNCCVPAADSRSTGPLSGYCRGARPPVCHRGSCTI